MATWAPQGNGAPGWLYLTRNPTPIAYWIPRIEDPTPVPVRLVMDERVFEDTILRVEKTSTHLYLADVWMFNGITLFHGQTFQQRQEFLRQLYQLYTPCEAFESFSVRLREHLTEYRGKEYYSNECGARGIYVEEGPHVVEGVFEVMRGVLPDVYILPANKEYLRVPTLALSRYLRSLGETFKIPCRSNRDGTWTPLVNVSSAPVTNGED